MQHLGMSMLWFWLGYFSVTIVGILHTVFNIYVRHMEPMSQEGMGEGYEKTKPWHPFYNIILFSIFGYLYLNCLDAPSLHEAIATGLLWTAICAAFDLFAWVVIRHPWSLTFRQFYVEYQPWLTLIYIAIFLGPVVGFLFCR